MAEESKTDWVEPVPDAAWLAQIKEEPLEPDMPIIDPHCHLWVMNGFTYMLPEYLADLRSGHNIIGTVYLECWTGYRSDGPVELRSVGETEFAYEQSVQSNGLVATGIAPYVNLRRPDQLDRVLDAHLAAAHGRLCGVRDMADWDTDPSLADGRIEVPENMLEMPEFHESLRRLGERGLSCDLWLYFHQLERLAEAAKAAPNTKIVVDHCGGPLGKGQYEGKYAEVFPVWAKGMAALSKCPNVYIKLGGMGMRWMGFGFHKNPKPPSSAELAAAWTPHMSTLIKLFGAHRCMFEANFTVDGEICSYVTLWNAFKRISANYSASERDALFRKTAIDVYNIQLPERA